MVKRNAGKGLVNWLGLMVKKCNICRCWRMIRIACKYELLVIRNNKMITSLCLVKHMMIYDNKKANK